ncbi:lactate oxidase [Photorhabdus antumapuensis]|uniref:lactate oxidase n=1 Tax=Photorhabdus antumapuensis TaxID=2862867 RepID=UPI001CED0BFD|nr:lactate oxidase [Photorhabdus antumapuensis]
MPSRRDVIVGGLSLAAAGTLSAVSSANAATANIKLTGTYKTNSAEKSLDIINLYDLEEEARKLIPAPQFGYISGGSGDEWTLRENTRAFDDFQIIPRYLAGVKEPDTTTELFGSKVDMPIFIPPMAAHGLAHMTAELGTARGAAAAGALFTAQTLSNSSLEEIAKVSNGPKWFQIYFTKDMGINRELIRRAKAMGATAIVFTVDLEWSGNRETDKRNKFVFPRSLPFPNIPGVPVGAALSEITTLFKRDLDFNDLEFLAKESGLPIIVKGIQSAENAKECVDHGAAAIQVSNHGGRQLDTVPAAIASLPSIVEAVGSKIPVYLDGGIRRGTHVFKALALGAKAVAIGRPILYALALGGAPGVTSILNLLKDELKLSMKLAGCAAIKDIERKFISLI